MNVVFDAGVVFSGAGWRGEAHLCLAAMARDRFCLAGNPGGNWPRQLWAADQLAKQFGAYTFEPNPSEAFGCIRVSSGHSDAFEFTSNDGLHADGVGSNVSPRMTTEQIKAHLQVSPFRPFRIVLADGHEIEVPHEDYVSIGPKGRTAVVWKPNGACSLVDIMLVTRLEFAEPKP
jgi:hypothetical protein